MFSIESGRKAAYSSDIRWRVVSSILSHALRLTLMGSSHDSNSSANVNTIITTMSLHKKK